MVRDFFLYLVTSNKVRRGRYVAPSIYLLKWTDFIGETPSKISDETFFNFFSIIKFYSFHSMLLRLYLFLGLHNSSRGPLHLFKRYLPSSSSLRSLLLDVASLWFLRCSPDQYFRIYWKKIFIECVYSINRAYFAAWASTLTLPYLLSL